MDEGHHAIMSVNFNYAHIGTNIIKKNFTLIQQ